MRHTYVLVRADIPLAQQLVQASHACLQAGARFPQPVEPCHLVILSVASQDHLRQAVEHLAGQGGIQMETFWEPDDALGFTASCSEPVSGQARRWFRRYPLWKP